MAGHLDSQRTVRWANEESNNHTVCRVAPMGDVILASADGALSVSGDCIASCTTGECPLSVTF